MVRLHIKKGDESQFLYETTVEMPVEDLIKDVTIIYNGRLKINRICAGNMILCLNNIYSEIKDIYNKFNKIIIFRLGQSYELICEAFSVWNLQNILVDSCKWLRLLVKGLNYTCICFILMTGPLLEPPNTI